MSEEKVMEQSDVPAEIKKRPWWQFYKATDKSEDIVNGFLFGAMLGYGLSMLNKVVDLKEYKDLDNVHEFLSLIPHGEQVVLPLAIGVATLGRHYVNKGIHKIFKDPIKENKTRSAALGAGFAVMISFIAGVGLENINNTFSRSIHATLDFVL